VHAIYGGENIWHCNNDSTICGFVKLLLRVLITATEISAFNYLQDYPKSCLFHQVGLVKYNLYRDEHQQITIRNNNNNK